MKKELIGLCISSDFPNGAGAVTGECLGGGTWKPGSLGRILILVIFDDALLAFDGTSDTAPFFFR